MTSPCRAAGTDPSSETTSILIFSDTHGLSLKEGIPTEAVDVCIHSGDLTEESKLEEFHTTLQLLRAVNAPLKLIIAGNHDFTLDTLAFKKKIEEIKPPLEPELVKEFYGDYEEARQLLVNAEKDNIHLLDEGTNDFILQNDEKLRVYSSPYTPSVGDWGFQYHPNHGHELHIQSDTDVVVTHGPPRGIMDRTSSRDRAGCPDLFAAIAKARPKLHCFGPIHEEWGAKMVAWRKHLTDKPSHLADIENEQSYVVEQLSAIQESKFDSAQDLEDKQNKLEKYLARKYCDAKCDDTGDKTLLVNAAIKGGELLPLHFPWLVSLSLKKRKKWSNADAQIPCKARQLDTHQQVREPKDGSYDHDEIEFRAKTEKTDQEETQAARGIEKYGKKRVSGQDTGWDEAGQGHRATRRRLNDDWY